MSKLALSKGSASAFACWNVTLRRPCKKARGLVEIGLAQIAANHRQSREGLGEIRKKAAAPACHVQEPKLPLIAASDELRNRRNSLAAHRARCPEKQGLNLDVVELCRFLREPAPGLIVEILHIVIRHASGLRQHRRLCRPVSQRAVRTIGVIIQHPPHGFDAARKRAAFFDGNGIKAIADIARVFCLKLQNILQEPECAGNRLGDFNANSITVKACARAGSYTAQGR